MKFFYSVAKEMHLGVSGAVTRLATCLLLAALSIASSSLSFAQTPVLTQHNNNARTGAYTTETVLTPANVNKALSAICFRCQLTAGPTRNPYIFPMSTSREKGRITSFSLKPSTTRFTRSTPIRTAV